MTICNEFAETLFASFNWVGSDDDDATCLLYCIWNVIEKSAIPLSNTIRNYELTSNYYTKHPLQLSSLRYMYCPMYVWVIQQWTLSIYFLTSLIHSLHDPGNFIRIFLLVAYSKPFLGLSSFILKRLVTHLPLSHLKLFVSRSVPFLVFLFTLKKRCLKILRFYFDRMQKKKKMSHMMPVWLSGYSIIMCGFGLFWSTRPLQGEWDTSLVMLTAVDVKT